MIGSHRHKMLGTCKLGSGKDGAAGGGIKLDGGGGEDVHRVWGELDRVEVFK